MWAGTISLARDMDRTKKNLGKTTAHHLLLPSLSISSSLLEIKSPGFLDSMSCTIDALDLEALGLYVKVTL